MSGAVVTTTEAARMLGVSMGTVRRWSDLGYLSALRTPGGQRRFRVDEIERFWERQREQQPVPRDG